MDIMVREFTKDDINAANAIWNSVVEDGIAFPQKDLLDEETGIPYTAVFQQTNIGGAYYDQMQQLGGEITYERIYAFALNKQENDFCSWFDPEKYKVINASNWKEFISS